MEIEINATQRTRSVALAENDSNVFVQSDAVAELGAPAFVGFNGLVQQRDKGSFEFFGRFIDTNDVPVVRLHSVRYLKLERFNCHARHSKPLQAEVKPKMGR